jgi:histidinol-phosphate/aromatic aminotransferase/cobyric acid decarboxylase-like protein
MRLPGARVGYALAGRDVADDLNRRQAPAPERLAEDLRRIGLDPWPSEDNFLYVPLDGAEEVADRLLRQGLAVRRLPDAIRITVRDQAGDERLVDAPRSA